MGGQDAGVLRLQLLLGDCMCALLLLSFGERCAFVCVCVKAFTLQRLHSMAARAR